MASLTMTCQGGRSSADEVADAVIGAAQREPEEAKLALLGKMLGKLAFDSRVD